jgi:hypothetical protein
MTTTSAAIRNRMLTVIEAITPATDSSVAFRRHREEINFRDWADATPTGCLRRFAVRDLGDARPALVSNTDVELVRAIFEVVIAYPLSYRFGTGINLLGVEDVIDQDRHRVEHAVGMRGYANFTAATGAEAAWVEGETARETSNVRFLVIAQSMEFYRSMP